MTPQELAKSGTEHAHQRALFAWCNMAARYGYGAANDYRCYVEKGFVSHYYTSSNCGVPELNLLFAIHNQGHGDAIRGNRAKAEGVKAGVPDLMLPVAISIYHGLFIEMKKPKVGKVSDIQSDWSRNLLSQGYQVVFAYGWQQARDYILEYLGL